MGEEHDLSTVLGWAGYREEFADVSEFTNYLGAYHPLSLEKLTPLWAKKWVFWSPEAYQKSPIIQNKIKTLVSQGIPYKCLIQFWAPIVVGNRCYLRTSDQPFAVHTLYKGLCWYRKHCMDHGDIIVDDGAKEEQLGAVGRVYLNGYPESTPDLRLYSTNELPLRDYAARCGARGYFVIPVFDLLKKECFGVLEYLCFGHTWMPLDVYIKTFEDVLQELELRTTHMKMDESESEEEENLIEGDQTESEEAENLIEKDTEMTKYEIRKMLKTAKEMVPQLHMAQVWIPCKQCANTTTALCCMELLDSMRPDFQDEDMDDYLDASKFHLLQPQKGIIAKTVMSFSNIKSCFCRNIRDFSQSENPLAHYAQKCRLSFCFAISLESLHNSDDLYYVEFFLQLNSRHDLHGVSLCHLLIGVMEMNLKSFKVISSDMLEVRKDTTSSSIELVPHKRSGILEGEKHRYVKEPNILTKMNTGWEMYPSELEFEESLQMEDQFSCFKFHKIYERTWLSWCQEREKLCENDENYSLQDKIKCLLTNLMKPTVFRLDCNLVQFWEPERDEGRCYITTSAQPFALSGLHTGTAFLRKQSTKHKYSVDEGVKEEELGPIGRVFRSGHLEMTHDILLYSTTEFPLKDDVAFCNCRSYIAVPIFDHQHKCLGVLECIGILVSPDFTLECIQKAVQETHLSSTYINNEPKFHGGLALSEIKKGLQLLNKIPQLHAMEVWVPHKNCPSTNKSLTCMQRVVSNLHMGVKFDLVETGKGVVGTVLTSENKCCYCETSCQFSMTEQSWSHEAQQKRLDVCFAICLQSSYTGDLPFVLNFFLNQGPGYYEYLWLFLYSLLPILKQELKSFKVATGKQLGEELVVDIIELSHEVNRPTPRLQFGQPNMFPVKFQIVQYGQQEHQQSNDQQGSEMDHVTSAIAEGNQYTTQYDHLEHQQSKDPHVNELNHVTSAVVEGNQYTTQYDHLEHQQSKDGVTSAVVEGNQSTTPVANLEKEADETSRILEKRKMRTGLRITLEDLDGQFGKSREDAAKNLSVSISTFKRACRFYGINRWPSTKKQRKNPSLYMARNGNTYDGDPQGTMGPSSSSLRLPLHESVSPTNIGVNQDLIIVPETDLVIMKAKYDDKIVKFQFHLSSGLENLAKEVATRLKLETGTFELKYVDEGNEHIPLTCDADLKLYVENAKVEGKNGIPVFVELLTHATGWEIPDLENLLLG